MRCSREVIRSGVQRIAHPGVWAHACGCRGGTVMCPDDEFFRVAFADRVSRGGLRVHARRWRIIVWLGVVVALCSCDRGISTRGGAVVNLTDGDLAVEVVGARDSDRRMVPARRSNNWTADDGCLGMGVALLTPDGEQLATLDRRICDGQRLAVRHEDLPSPSP
jgi:hypothetical protein